jgi:predicted XRE-type DNA-binding protein
VQDDLLTTKQASEILGVTQERVRQFVREGRIPTRLLEPIILIARLDLEAFEKLPRERTGRPRKSL